MQTFEYKNYIFDFLIVNKNRMKLVLLLPKFILMAIIAMLCFLLHDIYSMAIRYIHAPVARLVQDLSKAQKNSDNIPE